MTEITQEAWIYFEKNIIFENVKKIKEIKFISENIKETIEEMYSKGSILENLKREYELLNIDVEIKDLKEFTKAEENNEELREIFHSNFVSVIYEKFQEKLRNYFNKSSEEGDVEKKLKIFLLGIGLLRFFVRENFSGPFSHFENLEHPISLNLTKLKEQFKNDEKINKKIENIFSHNLFSDWNFKKEDLDFESQIAKTVRAKSFEKEEKNQKEEKESILNEEELAKENKKKKEEIKKKNKNRKSVEKRIILTKLTVDGETFTYSARKTFFFIAAKIIFDFLEKENVQIGSNLALLAYQARKIRIHQSFLSEMCSSCKEKSLHYIEKISDALKNFQSDDFMTLKSQMMLEACIVYSRYNMGTHFLNTLQSACDFIDLKIEMTGKLAKKTKFQKEFSAHLFLNVKNNPKYNEDSSFDYIEDSCLASSLESDSVLLEKPEFKKEEKNVDLSLSDLEVSILLQQCQSINKISQSESELNYSEMEAYLHTILHGNNAKSKNRSYVNESMSLIIKSRIEFEGVKTSHRSFTQFESLINQLSSDSNWGSDKIDLSNANFDFNTKSSSLSTEELTNMKRSVRRAKNVWGVNYISAHEMQIEFGKMNESMGLIKSALEIYKSLDSLDDAIRCLIILEKDETAIELIKKELEKEDASKAPLLWTLLGGLENNEEHFRTAYRISNNNFSRAMRDLGRMLIKNEKFKEAIEPLKESLRLNGLFEKAHFLLSVAYMKIEDYANAAKSLTNVVQINGAENYEAWVNLSSCYFKLNEKKKSLIALKEAIRISESNSNEKLWNNYLLLSVDTKDYNEAITALFQLFVLMKVKKDFNGNTEIIEMIVNEFEKNLNDLKTMHQELLKLKNSNQDPVFLLKKEEFDALNQKVKFNKRRIIELMSCVVKNSISELKPPIFRIFAYFYVLINDFANASHQFHNLINSALVQQGFSSNDNMVNYVFTQIRYLFEKVIPNFENLDEEILNLIKNDEESEKNDEKEKDGESNKDEFSQNILFENIKNKDFIKKNMLSHAKNALDFLEHVLVRSKESFKEEEFYFQALQLNHDMKKKYFPQ